VSEGVGEYQMKNRDFDLKLPNDAANKINKKKKRCKYFASLITKTKRIAEGIVIVTRTQTDKVP
jgi:hypothetical protein